MWIFKCLKCGHQLYTEDHKEKQEMWYLMKHGQLICPICHNNEFILLETIKGGIK